MGKASNKEMKIKIASGNVSAMAWLSNTKTAKAVWSALPMEASANRWGGEIYFPIPVKL